MLALGLQAAHGAGVGEGKGVLRASSERPGEEVGRGHGERCAPGVQGGVAVRVTSSLAGAAWGGTANRSGVLLVL